MPLRDQPYMPLYIQDVLTDEKLIECSVSAHGIYFRLLCIMHKSDPYGTILLKQKDKQTDNQIKNFALKLAKQMPFKIEEIESGLNELISEDVLNLNEDSIYQKRMVKDNSLSIVRSEAGKIGGKKTQFAKAKVKAKRQAKVKANTEYETETEDETINKNKDEISYPWDDEKFLTAWDLWKQYKKEQHNFKYKPIGEQGALKDLSELSKGNMEVGIAIIYQSIKKGWKGFFELKNKQGEYVDYAQELIKSMTNG